MPCVLIIGTLDTKGEEIGYLRAAILKRNCKCIVMDVGILSDPQISADIKREDVIERGGGKRSDLISAASEGSARGTAVSIVIKGGTVIAKELLSNKSFNGVISIGGSTGTSIGTSIMKELPLGIPKVQVSTLPGISKNLSPFFGQTDIMMLNSIVDMVGLNAITKTILDEAASAIAGMVLFPTQDHTQQPSIAITCLGVTTPMVMDVRKGLIDRGYEVVVLHRRTLALKSMVEKGTIKAVLDLTPNEMVDVVTNTGDEKAISRMHCVIDAGIPLIIAPGGLDMIIVPLPAKDISDSYKTRTHHSHTPFTTLVRTSKAELEKLGKLSINTLNSCIAHCGIVLPLKGFSSMDRIGSDFYDPEADMGYIQVIRNEVKPNVKVVEIDSSIISKDFVSSVLDMFDEIMTCK